MKQIWWLIINVSLCFRHRPSESLWAQSSSNRFSNEVINQGQITTTAINVEEQLRGRLAQVAEARDGDALSNSYQRLIETLMLVSEFKILSYNSNSHKIYQSLKAQGLRIGTQDLRIAAITLAHNGILLTRNLCDFEKVPKLITQDWSI